MPRLAMRSAVLLASLALPGAAGAAEYCVTCEGPPAMYRCVVDGTADGPGQDARASLVCISEMAARGKHESCAVSRGAPFPCPGLTSVVAAGEAAPSLAAPAPAASDPAAPEPLEPAAAAPPVATDPAQPATGEATAASEEPAKVPRTVEELAGQTVKSSKESLAKAGAQIGSAGTAVGDAASKTWACISSFFTSCGSETEPQE